MWITLKTIVACSAFVGILKSIFNMSKYAQYMKLAQLPTEYSRRMDRLSKRIFGEVARPTNSKSVKVVKLFTAEPVNKRKEIHAYYPRHPETGRLIQCLRYYGLFRDEHTDFTEEMKRMRALRGKAPPDHKFKTPLKENPI